ncbi:hypothetical protein K466DRAFT_331260 [Polyporus arcularius HHB13444]|uniref:Uncharacterized protein n=1 Tax=Polyporus arcularius HHB13444 TaxID=1314778 RepID=A0A5C3NX24_9APHY|nr:hypothetical protein K466DRAFT_331260 [Polyporus arcularius HHB13444]
MTAGSQVRREVRVSLGGNEKNIRRKAHRVHCNATHMSSSEQIKIADGAAVAARAIVWVGDLTDQQKSDVLESTLIAQLAADKQYSSDSEDDTLTWYKKYADTLGSVGWRTNNAAFTEVSYDRTEGTIHDTVLEQLANDPTVSKALYASVSRALLAFARTGSGSDAEKVFDSASIASSSEFASFQLAVASVNADGDLNLTLLAWFYSSNQKIGSTLWFSWKNASLNLQTSTLTMTLNVDLYDQVRFSIHDKLDSANKLELLVPL